MNDFSDRMDRLDKVQRTVRTARTYVRKCRDLVWVDPAIFRGAMYDYERLVLASLDAAAVVVENADDEWFRDFEVEDWFGLAKPGESLGTGNLSDDLLEAAEKLVAALVARRKKGKKLGLIEKLSNVEGRTPEEAKAFLAKARELRTA